MFTIETCINYCRIKTEWKGEVFKTIVTHNKLGAMFSETSGFGAGKDAYQSHDHAISLVKSFSPKEIRNPTTEL